MCRLSPGCDPQPTTQRGPQDYLCSSLFLPEVAYLALNPYGSGRQGAGPPKCWPQGPLGNSCLPALPSETRYFCVGLELLLGSLVLSSDPSLCVGWGMWHKQPQPGSSGQGSLCHDSFRQTARGGLIGKLGSLSEELGHFLNKHCFLSCTMCFVCVREIPLMSTLGGLF